MKYAVLLAPLFLTWSAVAPSVADAATPNVIPLMSDDQGWGDVGCNGNAATVRTIGTNDV